MHELRRILQVVTFVATLLIGVLALALIVSQTPWFRDWLRRYIVRESAQYLKGQMTIGGLDGNLLFGIGLSDVALDVSGERVVAAKALKVDYNVFSLISKGVSPSGTACSSSSAPTSTSMLNKKPTDSSLIASIIAVNMSKPSRWYSTSGSRWE